MPFGLTPLHLIIILVVALIIVGPGKLPSLGKALGESIREFRQSVTDVKEAVNLDPPPVTPPSTSPAPPVIAAPVAVSPPAPLVAEVPPSSPASQGPKAAPKA